MPARPDEDSLFAAAPIGAAGREPLAARMRPRTLDEFAGQEHIVGPGRLLRRAIQKDQLSSIILSGPPGTGKTTLARVIANGTSSRFVTLNAVLAGVADIRAAIDEAKRYRELYDRKTILFVDEVHRWNKAQQDALLPWVENGTFILIGATTENPFFEVNRALVSRSRVFQLRALEDADLLRVANFALVDKERGYGRWKVVFEEGALEHLVSTADGDARSLLNALELAVETSSEPWPPSDGSEILVTMATAEESIQRRAVLYDKDGDYHYDAASAFIKSLRGSDPDAALYWLARMIYAGEDPRFAFRRMLISACEDVGLADPEALRVVLACAETFDRVGMPEGQFPLAEAALYLATAPKSNSALGFFDALKAVEAESAEVPDHLKDASRDAKGFGHGEGYLYPHAYRDHWIAQQYLPDSLRGRVFYQPGSLGLESERAGLVLERREAQLLSFSEGPSPDHGSDIFEGSWSGSGDAKARWRARAESSAPARLFALRRALFDSAALSRSSRILVPEAREGYLVWEALRRAPDGTVAALAAESSELELIEQYARTLPEIERPLTAQMRLAEMTREALEAALGFSTFDLVIGRGLFTLFPDDEPKGEEAAAVLERFAAALPGARFVCAEDLPREGGRLSSILSPAALGGDLAARFSAFESDFYKRRDIAALGLSFEELETSLRKSGMAGLSVERRVVSYPRNFGRDEIAAWLSTASPYGAALSELFDDEELSRLALALQDVGSRKALDWPFAIALVTVSFPPA
jgi:putative ATPase